jgi:hypothetical protein
MSNTSWHTGIDPKVMGTWNLHNAIQGKESDLEFFLMTSSVSGSVGTATEANYCSGNFFLDIFSRYRRSLGLPAIAVGLGMISEVGYLHDNPEIEALLLRKGIQALDEDELLQILDIALSSSMDIPHVGDSAAQAHILTGLEPLGLLEQRRQGFEATSITYNDPRASILAGVLDGNDAATPAGPTSGLPASVIEAMEAGTSLEDAVYASVASRFGNLVLLPVTKIEERKPLSAYGMDSMIAAEFRTWFFQSFKVDIPFQELLNKSSTIGSLASTVTESVSSRS